MRTAVGTVHVKHKAACRNRVFVALVFGNSIRVVDDFHGLIQQPSLNFDRDIPVVVHCTANESEITWNRGRVLKQGNIAMTPTANLQRRTEWRRDVHAFPEFLSTAAVSAVGHSVLTFDADSSARPLLQRPIEFNNGRFCFGSMLGRTLVKVLLEPRKRVLDLLRRAKIGDGIGDGVVVLKLSLVVPKSNTSRGNDQRPAFNGWRDK